MLVIRSSELDPYYNLALEEALLDRVDAHGLILYFYQNENAVVIGKNQNPWRECRLQVMQEEGCRLARRITGGGAVYHDVGNLNFSFMMERTAYKEGRQYDIVLAALQTLGVEGRLEGRNSLYCDDYKFSGNAFCFRKTAALHHGTLLVDADLDKLHRYLGPSMENLTTKAIASIPARVMNLADRSPSIHEDVLIERITEAAARAFDSTAKHTEVEALNLDLSTAQHDHASWEWLYGRTPTFAWKGNLQLDGRVRPVSVTVEKGLVTGVDNNACSQALLGQRWSADLIPPQG